MSECSCVPPHRAWGQATSKDCLYLSGMLRMKTGMEKTSRPPRCGFPIPSHRTTERGPSRNLENSTKSQRRLHLQIIIFPQNSEADILQGMSRHFESSSLQKFTALFSFAACPSLPKWCSHSGCGPGVSDPQSLIKQEMCFGHNVSNGKVGGI